MLKIRMIRAHADYRAGQVYDVPENPGEMWVARGLAELVVDDSLIEAVSLIAPESEKLVNKPVKGKVH